MSLPPNPNQPWRQSSTKATSPTSTTLVQDIVTLKWAFPDSLDTIENISGTYTIRDWPKHCPCPACQRKTPIEYLEQIEHTLNDMVDKEVIAPVFSAYPVCIFPQPIDGTLCICLNPKDLNKALVWEHYQSPYLRWDLLSPKWSYMLQ